MPALQALTVSGFVRGYRPVDPMAGPGSVSDCVYAGANYWIRPGGRLQPVKGIYQYSATAIGPRIWPLDQYRGEIAGALVSSVVPKSALVRYQNAALFFVSEETDKQVYINESTSTPFTITTGGATAVKTSTTAGKLRVALLSGTTYSAYDAGLTSPMLPSGNVSIEANGSKSMAGVCSIRVAARRIATDTTSNPSEANVQTLVAAGNNRFRVVLSSLASGQDGWLFGGTMWGSGNYGPWKEIREIKVSLTVGCTNGSAAVTLANAYDYLNPGDRITINATNYYVASGTSAPSATGFNLASDAAGTTPINFAGATNSYTGTVIEVTLDYRNAELGDEMEFDNDPPPLCDGIMLFNNVPFIWKDNVLYPSKIGNPEAYPLVRGIPTQSGANIVQALAGEGKIYLLTTNTLEVVTFTQREDVPYLIRVAWNYGFTSPTQAVIADGTLYAAVGSFTADSGNASIGVKIVRTRVDDSPDNDFSANIESDLTSWQLARVVMTVDPANGAVLACQRDNSSATTVIPWMTQQGIWGIPQTITGQVTDAATIRNATALSLLVSGTHTANQYEGGNGSLTSSWACTPWMDAGLSGIRKVLKRIKITGKAESVKVYTTQPGASALAINSTGTNAVLNVNIASGITGPSLQIQTNLPNAELYAIQVNGTGATGNCEQIIVAGIPNPITK